MSESIVRIEVGYKDNEVYVDPESVTVYYDYEPGPNAVRWEVVSFPDNAAVMEIKWKEKPAFVNYAINLVRGQHNLFGLGVIKEKGQSPYSVIFRDAQGNVVAQVDPVIIRDPWPPGGP